MSYIPGAVRVELLSDLAVSSGATSAHADREVDFDELGLPRIKGGRIKRAMRDAWLSMEHAFPELTEPARGILGRAEDHTEAGILRIDTARVGDDVRAWVEHACTRPLDPWHSADVLDGLTAVRSQTAIESGTGAPARGTLRSTRVVVRSLEVDAQLNWLDTPTSKHVRCLAMSTLAVRHLGLSRNRGLGHVRLSLDGDVTATQKLVLGEERGAA